MPIIDLGELNASFNVRVPVGTIVIWSGSVDNIPKGWHLCDGEDGTPDLRDKFVVGAGNEYQPEDEGGEKEVTLTVDQIPKHTHSFMTHTLGREEVGNYNVPIYQQNVQINNSANTYSTGKDEPHNNLPPYFALCYIMKLTADETDVGTGVDFTVDDTLNMSPENVLGVANPVKGVITQETYDQLSDEEKRTGTYIIPTADIGVGGNGEVYSTSEVRIGTWIDGKPLYRKTFDVTTPSKADSSVDIVTIGSGLQVKNIYGMIDFSSSENLPFNFSYVPSQATSYLYAWPNSNRIRCVCGSQYLSKPGWITIEYTKTTD